MTNPTQTNSLRLPQLNPLESLQFDPTWVSAQFPNFPACQIPTNFRNFDEVTTANYGRFVPPAIYHATAAGYAKQYEISLKNVYALEHVASLTSNSFFNGEGFAFDQYRRVWRALCEADRTGHLIESQFDAMKVTAKEKDVAEVNDAGRIVKHYQGMLKFYTSADLTEGNYQGLIAKYCGGVHKKEFALSCTPVGRGKNSAILYADAPLYIQLSRNGELIAKCGLNPHNPDCPWSLRIENLQGRKDARILENIGWLRIFAEATIEIARTMNLHSVSLLPVERGKMASALYCNPLNLSERVKGLAQKLNFLPITSGDEVLEYRRLL